MSKEEKAARERLESLGIKAEQLEAEIGKGARSPLIATYRIVIHRLLVTPNNVQPTKPQKSRACALL